VRDFVRRLRWKGPVFAVSALAREGLEGLVRETYAHVVAQRRPQAAPPDVRFEESMPAQPADNLSSELAAAPRIRRQRRT
jgi:GTP-binding protein